MTTVVRFDLDGETVEAGPDETIWQVAKRRGNRLPHLCHLDQPAYEPSGNCRACMVEVEGERTLVASCIRKVSDGMVVRTNTKRADMARRMVFELLAADMPGTPTDDESQFEHWMNAMGMSRSRRFSSDQDADDGEGRHTTAAISERDVTHAAIAVNLDSCVRCGLCVRACREVQVNDVIGMAERGDHALPVFDFADPLAASTCVACGECVQACPTGALFEKPLMDEGARARIVKPAHEVDTVCPYCGVGCQITTRVAADETGRERIVQVDGRNGPANENRLCVKGRFGFDYVSSPERLTVPLIRRDDAPKSGDAHVTDWREVFREATWDEALHRAASGFTSIRDGHGSGALAGFGSAKGSNEEAYLFQKLVRTGFGTNNVDHCTRLCHASSVAALMEGVGSGAVSAPFTAADDADCIVVIGARPTQNHPVAATYLKRAAKRGTKLIVMDPRGQDLMRHATHQVRFTPGTDVALLNAMLYVIVAERLYDEQYIQANVHGFDALREKIAEFSPEVMEPVCGIAADDIRELARTYANAERSIIFWGMGVSQHVHGTDNARCLIALALVTGHVGQPGTGLHPLRGQNNVQGASDAGLIPMVYPDYKSVEDADVRARFEDAWCRTLDPARGLTVVEVMDAAHEGSIRGLFVMGENPAMSDPDQTHAREGLAKLGHLVVQDIFLTETAWHADVVLPASAHAEKLGTYTNTNRQVQLGRPVVAMPGEARRDLDILIDLANRLGCDWSYTGPADVYAEMASLMPSLANIPWKRVEREGAVTYPAPSETEPGAEIIFREGFPTADGRARLVPANLISPDEMPDEAFPLVLTTGRLLEHWHTGAMTRRADMLDAIEPEPVAALNPRELHQNGLSAGDAVIVETRRGTITLTARADSDVPPGMVFVPFCFGEAPANVLTNPQLDPFGKIPEFKFCAARIVPALQDAAE